MTKTGKSNILIVALIVLFATLLAAFIYSTLHNDPYFSDCKPVKLHNNLSNISIQFKEPIAGSKIMIDRDYIKRFDYKSPLKDGQLSSDYRVSAAATIVQSSQSGAIEKLLDQYNDEEKHETLRADHYASEIQKQDNASIRVSNSGSNKTLIYDYLSDIKYAGEQYAFYESTLTGVIQLKKNNYLWLSISTHSIGKKRPDAKEVVRNMLSDSFH